jgi:hypothetical protein
MVMLLTWRIEGETLVTNQPSAPREERTAYILPDDRTLILSFGGQKSRYVRRT